MHYVQASKGFTLLCVPYLLKFIFITQKKNDKALKKDKASNHSLNESMEDDMEEIR